MILWGGHEDMSKLQNSLVKGIKFDEFEEVEDSRYISEIPTNILKSAIITQFDEPLEYRKRDYIQQFITKFNYLRDDMDDDYDLDELKEARNDFVLFVTEIFDKKLDISFVDIGEKSEEVQNDLLHYAYLFFIKNIRKNFINILTNEIKTNKSELASKYEKRRDVTYLTFINELDDEEIVLILSNLSDVINVIIAKMIDSYDVDEFFRMCDSGECNLNLEFIKDAYNKFDITGNFIEKYALMIDNYFKVELEARLRSNILKDYPDRTYKDINADVDNTDDENETSQKKII